MVSSQKVTDFQTLLKGSSRNNSQLLYLDLSNLSSRVLNIINNAYCNLFLIQTRDEPNDAQPGIILHALTSITVHTEPDLALHTPHTFCTVLVTLSLPARDSGTYRVLFSDCLFSFFYQIVLISYFCYKMCGKKFTYVLHLMKCDLK